MKGISRACAGAIASVGLALAGCGGGGGNGNAVPPPPPANFNMQTGIANMVAHGLTANVSLSGSVNVNGTSTPFTGSGTYTRSAAVNGTFNGAVALAQTQTISGTVTAAGQSSPYSASVTDYYATGNSAFLGEVAANEYDVAQAPFQYPGMIVGGSAGTLGTVSRYTDNTMSVSLGTVQVSYTVQAPVDPGSPIGITLTDKIYDAQNALLETDVTNFTMTSSNVISFVSASAQRQSGTITVTAQ
jgi:hypothetical protein